MSRLGPAVESLAGLGGTVLVASLTGALFVALVWLATRLVPSMPPRLRALLWWLAAAKLLVALVWTSPVELGLLPPLESAESVESVEPADRAAARSAGSADAPLPVRAVATMPAAVGLVPPGSSTAATVEGADRRPGSPITWLAAVLVLLWVAGVGRGLVRLGGELRAVRRLLREARPLGNGPAAALCQELAGRLDLDPAPSLHLSDRVRSPQVVGTLRPRVLLPADGLDDFSRDELAMTLCHELAHVRRRDLLFGWVPALAERLFFFHPLASLAAREYSLAREAACDATVLEVLGTAPRDVGRLILRWGVAPRETGLAAASASPSFATLKRRLEMLQDTSSRRRPSQVVWWSAVVVAFLGLVPFTIVAQSAPEPPPAAEAPEPVAPASAPVAPEAAPGTPALAPVPRPELGHPAPEAPAGRAAAPGAVPAPRAAGLPHPAAAPSPEPPAAPATPRAVALAPPGGVVGVAPLPAPAPLPARAAAPGAHSSSGPAPRPPVPPRSGSYTWVQSHGDGPSFVLLEGERSMVVNSSSGHLEKADELRRDGEPLLLVERDGQAWVIRERAILRQAHRLVEPQRELGRRQGELGGRQGDLGAEQAELGSRQAELGARQAALGAELGRLTPHGAAAERRREIEREMETLGERREELGARQRELGERQRDLGRRQGELGEKQRVAAAEASAALSALLDRAIDQGLAERVE